MKRTIGEIWQDKASGLNVRTVEDTAHIGCRRCAYATRDGGACCGAEYDRHPCMPADREDGREVFFLLKEKTGDRRPVRSGLFIFPLPFRAVNR